MRSNLLIASGLLVAFTSLFGQNSFSQADPMATAVTNHFESEHGRYVSGFEIPIGKRDFNVEDLGYYPLRILSRVRSKWYPQIPELQKSIEIRPGITVIEIEIKNDGSLGKMTIVGSAGDDSLNNAASEAISSSAPFARLPEAYHQKRLRLRMHFGYGQPASAEAPMCDGPNWGAHQAAYVLHQLGSGVTPPKATYAPDPEYSEEARLQRYTSLVQVAGTVDPQGSFTDLCVLKAAGAGLDEKAMEAVKTWRFEPANLRGEPVAVRIQVETSFRLY